MYSNDMQPSDEIYIHFVIIMLGILGITLLIFTSIWPNPHEDAQNELTQYCEMVATWESNLHIEPLQRPGWPPYKGEGVCDE